ncbi:MAG: hypothetical protein K2L28_06885, partial [Muribaculaceae bacterium]|nr:hypothetical protein [Muribaculaceae bacterium]
MIIFYGIAMTLFSMTLIGPWGIIAASIAFAAVTALVFRRKWRIITGTQNGLINLLCHLVVATGLCMATILGVNFFDRDTSDSVTVRAEVVRVYSETRHRTKRVARNRYT